MATLLWLALGVLMALVTWLLPAVTLAGILLVVVLLLVALLLPRSVTSIGAWVGIGFGATFVVIFAPNVVRDPLGTTAATYLMFGGGLLVMVGGLVGLWRYRRWQLRSREAAAGHL